MGFGREMYPPNWWILLSYLPASVGVEAFRIALENGDVTREGYLAALNSIDSFQAGGLIHEPVSLTAFPYQAGTQVRIMHPAFESRSWSVVADYAPPLALESTAP